MTQLPRKGTVRGALATPPLKSMRILKFLVSGGAAALVEYAVFLFLQTAEGPQHLILSQSVSFACGFVVSFLLNRCWVFRSEGRMGGELARYATLAAFNLVASNLALGLMVNALQVPAPLAKFLVMGMVAVWNYVIFSRLVFKPAAKPDTD